MLRLLIAGALVWMVLLGATFAQDSQSGRRLALVIGNSDYQTVPKLKNAVSDAELIARRFDDAGFDVTLVLDGSLEDMSFAVEKVSRVARPNDHVAFYYSGHGFQLDGTNFLVPTDAILSSEDLIHTHTMPLNNAIAKLQANGSQVMAFIDACRDNPLPPSTRGDRSVNGLAKLGTGVADNLFVAYAAGPGQVSVDGAGDHSPFAISLARNVLRPDLGVDSLVMDIRNEVREATLQKQIVWSESSLRSQFYFIGGQRITLGIGEPTKPIEVGPENIIIDSDVPSSVDLPVPAPPGAEPSSSSASSSSSEPPVSVEPVPGTEAAASSSAASEEGPQPDASSSSSSAPPPDLPGVPTEPSADSTPSSDVLTADIPSIELPPSIEISLVPRLIQIELQRLGCYPGSVDGKWGNGSRRALQAFADEAGIMVAVLEPSPALWAKLQSFKGPVCPAFCPPTEVGQNGVCVPRSCPEGGVLSVKGVCENGPTDTGVLTPDVVANLPFLVQTELKRVGCYTGKLDGDWGQGSRRALGEFGTRAGIAIAATDPTPEVYLSLKGFSSSERVCPLACSITQVEQNGQCVTKTCESGKKLNRSTGECEAPKVAQPANNGAGNSPPPKPKAGGDCFTFNGETFCE